MDAVIGLFQSIPAYAGLYLRSVRAYFSSFKYPRIRGVVSLVVGLIWVLLLVSPHTRGCIVFYKGETIFHWSIPAYAGLYLQQEKDSPSMEQYPRIRGVVSYPLTVTTFWY